MPVSPKSIGSPSASIICLQARAGQFNDDLVVDSEEGGRKAASLLRTAVTAHVEQQEPGLHGFDVLVRVYANSSGLSRTYAGNRILKTAAQFELFVRGFNSSHALCDFVDSGEGKECADEKLRGKVTSLSAMKNTTWLMISAVASVKHYVDSVHCRYIVFGGSGDNGYARLLGPYCDNATVRKRICMVEGPPFARELAALADKFSVTSFPQVFRASKLPTPRTLTSQTVPNSVALTYASTVSQANHAPRVPVQGRDVPLQPQSVVSQRKKNRVFQNSKGERIDSDLLPNNALVAAQKKLKACNPYLLNGTCPFEKCFYSHEEMSEAQLEARRFVARLSPCDFGLACEDHFCLSGHRCPRPHCQWGSECKFPKGMHNVSRDGIRPLA